MAPSGKRPRERAHGTKLEARGDDRPKHQSNSSIASSGSKSPMRSIRTEKFLWPSRLSALPVNPNSDPIPDFGHGDGHVHVHGKFGRLAGSARDLTAVVRCSSP